MYDAGDRYIKIEDLILDSVSAYGNTASASMRVAAVGISANYVRF